MYLNLNATKAAREHSQATGPAYAVLLALCFFADEQTWQADPSKEALADESRLSVPTVKRALKTLEDLGELLIEERPVPGKKHKTNLYTITLPRPTAQPSKPKRPASTPAPAPKEPAVKMSPGLDRLVQPQQGGHQTLDKLAFLRQAA